MEASRFGLARKEINAHDAADRCSRCAYRCVDSDRGGTFTFQVVTLGSASSPANDDLPGVEHHLLRLVVWSLVAVLLSAVLWFWLELVNMSGLSFKNAFSAATWRMVLFETQFGRVWQLRLGLIAIMFVLVISELVRNDARRRLLILFLWLLSVVLIVSLAWISHAAAAKVQPLGLLGDALHLFAAGAWIGGLAPLAIFLTRARMSLSLGKCAAPVLRRFSALSLCCVSGLIVTGICNSWQLVGSFHALFTTRYGWLLLVKLALFGMLISIGARNRLAIRTKPSTAQAGSHSMRQLRRNVIYEACLGAAVVAIVACLGATPPARHP
jgi:copper resistance protein D